MAMVERFRLWYEQERDANAKMLAMIESVPSDRRADTRFERALVLAAHLAACRENWLDRMASAGENQVDWFQESAELDSLRPRFADIESRWMAYLDSLADEDLDRDFDFPVRDGRRYRWNVEGQIVQLVGHAFYHRGQIALLVDELGGETVDTDYLFWAYERNPNWGPV